MIIPFKYKIFIIKNDEKIIKFLMILMGTSGSLFLITYFFFGDNTQLMEFLLCSIIVPLWIFFFFFFLLNISWADYYKWCCRDFYWTLKEKYPEIMAEIWDELIGMDPNDKELKNGLMGINPINEELKHESKSKNN